MRRVLLVVDDYNEMIRLQTLLKKVGFDTVAIQNEQQVQDQMLAFRPEIIVADFKGSRIHALELSKKVKRLNGWPRFALIVGVGMQVPQEQLSGAAVDAVISQPFTNELMLRMLAHLGQLEMEALVGKYRKLVETNVIIDDAPNGDGGRQTFSTISSADRAQRYAEHVEKLPPPHAQAISHARVRTETLEMRSMELSEELDDLEEERRSFVRHLFKRGS